MTTALATIALATALIATPDDGGQTTFACTGQVALVCGGVPQRFALLQSRHDGRYSLSRSFWLKNPDKHSFESGDIISVSVKIEPSAGLIWDEKPNEDAFIVTSLKKLGHEPLPKAKNVGARQIGEGNLTSWFVSVTGVVSAVMRDEMNPEWNWFVLRTSEGNVYVAATDHEHPYSKLLSLTDADVVITGLGHRQKRWRRFIGPYLIITGTSGIEVVHPPPAEQDLHELSGSDLDAGDFAIQFGKGEFVHRVKTDGTLVASGRRFSFIRMKDGSLMKALPIPGSSPPPPGTYLSAAGFVSLDYGGLQLTDATMTPVTCEDVPPEPKPTKPIKLDELFKMARNSDAASTAGMRRLVTVTGTVASSPENIAADKAIRIIQGGNFATIDVSAFADEEFSDVMIGCTIRATGVCNAEFESEPSIATFPRFTGISIFPATADDILVTVTPPWWTTGRLVAVIISLLGLLAIISGLCIALKILSDRRGRQLYDMTIAHVRAETKVEERTRLAVELHDAISQTLTGVTLQVDSAGRANDNGNERVDTFLKTARQMLASCRRELQDCLWDLRSRTFEEKDMTEAIIRAIGPYTEDVIARVRFNVPRDRLSESTMHAILCIVRELTANAIRHGKAKHVKIAGVYDDGTIAFSVRDDGIGFDSASAPGPREGHFGIQGIRERVYAAKGTVTVESRKGKGARIAVTMVEEQ